MATRNTPYGAYNFLVDLGDGTDPTTIIGGFSEVTGLSTEVKMMEYRVGNERENHVRNITGMNTSGQVTFRRGMCGLTTIWDWIKATRTDPDLARDLTITLQDEQQNPIVTYQLRNARPSKLNATAMNAKGGSDVAIEELVVSVESFEVI